MARVKKFFGVGLADSAERIANDLLNLEINTIIASGMMAQKMPEPAHALLDIAKLYQCHLVNVQTQANRVWERLPKSEPQESVSEAELQERLSLAESLQHLSEVLKGLCLADLLKHIFETESRERLPAATLRIYLVILLDCLFKTELRERYADEPTFHALREQVEGIIVARDLLRNLGAALSAEEDVILLRIQRNCDLLRSLFRGLKDRGVNIGAKEISREALETLETREKIRRKLMLLPHEMVTLRKIWDIGTSRVVMQTVVQLDGDVVNRIQQGCETAAFKCLHDAHSDLVRTSLGQWQFLAKAVVELVGAVFRK